MKKWLHLLAVTACLFSIQCTDESPIKSDDKDLEIGNVSLRIEKINAPADVIVLEVFLTREEHDTLYGSLNLITSASADIAFEDIEAGKWHLKVDAKDSSGIVLYRGKSKVDILAGILTTVNLKVRSIADGTGKIFIEINMGQNQAWVDHNKNPVMKSQDNKFNKYGIYQPFLLKDGNLFKMWYTGDAGLAKTYGLYAESKDGINWKHNVEPVLSPGEEGSWDSWAVHPGPVIKENNLYKMYYTGWSDMNGHWNIGLATSTDGINWTKNPNPVLSGNNNEYQITATSVIKIDDIYHMYYTGGYYQQVWWISLATSRDGVNWERYSGNPLLTTTHTWEGYGVYHSSVLEENEIYKMVYMGTSSNAFGIATSTDGKNWTTMQSNPFFTIANTHNNWTDRIAYPNFVKASESEIRVYYNGIPKKTNYYTIAFLKKLTKK